MSLAMQKTLEAKIARRQRLQALSYPEKVRIVEQMQRAAKEVKAAAQRRGLHR